MALVKQSLPVSAPKLKVLIDNQTFYPIDKQLLSKKLKIIDFNIPIKIDTSTNTFYVYPFTAIVDKTNYYFGDITTNTEIFSYVIPDDSLYYVGLSYNTSTKSYDIIITTDPSEFQLTLAIINNYKLIWSAFDNKDVILNGNGFIIPAYIYPTSSYFDYLLYCISKIKSEILVVINPNSGPGSTVDINYIDIILKLKNLGAKVFGYVPTSYGSASTDTILGSIDIWKKFYPMIDGIFFDEVSSSATYLSYYDEVVDYSKQYDLLTIGNFGTLPDDSYIKNNIFDVNLIYENNRFDYSVIKKIYKDSIYDRTETAFVLTNIYSDTSTTTTVVNKILLPTSTLNSSIKSHVVPGTLSLTVTVGGTQYTITDDGYGNLTESTILKSGSIDYITGNFTITLNSGYALDVGSTVTATFTAPDYTKAVDIYFVVYDIFGYIYITQGNSSIDPYNVPSVYLERISEKLDEKPDITVGAVVPEYALPGDTISLSLEPTQDPTNPRYIYSVIVDGVVVVDKTVDPNISFTLPTTVSSGDIVDVKIVVEDTMTGALYTTTNYITITSAEVTGVTASDNTFPVDTDITLTASGTSDDSDPIVDYEWIFEDGSVYNGKTITVKFDSNYYNNGDIVNVNVYAITQSGLKSKPFTYQIKITKITSLSVITVEDSNRLASFGGWNYNISPIVYKSNMYTSAINIMPDSKGYMIIMDVSDDFKSSTCYMYYHSSDTKTEITATELTNLDINTGSYIGTDLTTYSNFRNDKAVVDSNSDYTYLYVKSTTNFIYALGCSLLNNNNLIFDTSGSLYDITYSADSSGNKLNQITVDVTDSEKMFIITDNGNIISYDVNTKSVIESYNPGFTWSSNYELSLVHSEGDIIHVMLLYSDGTNSTYYLDYIKFDLSTSPMTATHVFRLNLSNRPDFSVFPFLVNSSYGLLVYNIGFSSDGVFAICNLNTNSLKIVKITDVNGNAEQPFAFHYDDVKNILNISTYNYTIGRMSHIQIQDPLNATFPLSSTSHVLTDVTDSYGVTLDTSNLYSSVLGTSPASDQLVSVDSTTVTINTTTFSSLYTLTTIPYTPIINPLG